jgi:hypothetical protein
MYYSSICLEWLIKITENSQDSPLNTSLEHYCYTNLHITSKVFHLLSPLKLMPERSTFWIVVGEKKLLLDYG